MHAIQTSRAVPPGTPAEKILKLIQEARQDGMCITANPSGGGEGIYPILIPYNDGFLTAKMLGEKLSFIDPLYARDEELVRLAKEVGYQ